MFPRALAVIWCWIALSCSSIEPIEDVATTVDGCKEQFAASNGYGYASDLELMGTKATAPSGSAGASATQTRTLSPLERALAECQSGSTGIEAVDSPNGGAIDDANAAGAAAQPGTNCEYARLITHDAAVCIARARGLPERLGYAAAIVYLVKYRRIVWLVNNTTVRSSDEEAGTSMTLDATTGAVLETTSWNATS